MAGKIFLASKCKKNFIDNLSPYIPRRAASRRVMEMETRDYEDVVARLGVLYEEVRGCEFYEELFPDNECSGDSYEDYSHPNAIYLLSLIHI